MEPFFTTKGVGKGTGLGLSITHGIITSVGGEITVESEPGKGTAVSIALPIIEPSGRPPSAATGQSETAQEREIAG
jgi:signal transduction histidine kinase